VRLDALDHAGLWERISYVGGGTKIFNFTVFLVALALLPMLRFFRRMPKHPSSLQRRRAPASRTNHMFSQQFSAFKFY
jgi:hypothetical protein